jgi:hypothetical protein
MADRRSSSARVFQPRKSVLLAFGVVLVLGGLAFLVVWSGPAFDSVDPKTIDVPLGDESARPVEGHPSNAIESHPSNTTVVASSDDRKQLATEAPAPWSVRVLDASKHEPISGARVELGADRWRVEGTSGGDGVLVLQAGDRPDLREADLLVEHPSFAPARVPALKRGEMRDVLLSRGGEIRGRCLPTPASPATVALFEQISEDSRNWKSRRATTDPAGGFEFAELSPGDYSLSATAEQWSANTLHSIRVESGEVHEVILSLSPETILHGRLLLPDIGLAVAGARVSISVQEDTQASLDSSTEREVLTGADGRFEMHGLAATSYSLLFRTCDHSSFRRPLAVNQVGGILEQDFIAPPELSVHGTAIDPDKNPVAGATFVLVPDLEWPSVYKDIAHLPVDRFPSARSQGDGSFVLSLRTDAPGHAYLFSRGPDSPADGLSWTLQPVSGERGSNEADAGPVIIARANAIQGVVKDERGAGVSGAAVDAQGGCASSATSGGGGVFSIVVPDFGRGRWTHVQLTARSPGFSSGAVQLISQKPVELVLHPIRTVTGRVIDADGRAVPYVPIVLGTQLPDHHRGPKLGGGDFPEHADAYGRFRFPDVVCMESEVAFDPKMLRDWRIVSRVPALIPAGGDQDVTVVVSRAAPLEKGTLRGRVRIKGLASPGQVAIEALPQRPSSTEPAAGAYPPGAAERGILSMNGDAFTLDNVAPGRIVLIVKCDHCRTAQMPLDLRAGETLDVGEIELVRVVQVMVALVDADNHPVKEATVELVPIDGSAGPGSARSWHDAWIFEMVPCGVSFDLHVHRAGRDDHVQRVDVPADPKQWTESAITVRLE